MTRTSVEAAAQGTTAKEDEVVTYLLSVEEADQHAIVKALEKEGGVHETGSLQNEGQTTDIDPASGGGLECESLFTFLEQVLMSQIFLMTHMNLICTWNLTPLGDPWPLRYVF